MKKKETMCIVFSTTATLDYYKLDTVRMCLKVSFYRHSRTQRPRTHAHTHTHTRFSGVRFPIYQATRGALSGRVSKVHMSKPGEVNINKYINTDTYIFVYTYTDI